MPKLANVPLIADTLVIIVERKDRAFILSTNRAAAPIPSTAPRVGYLTSRAHAGAILETVDRHYAGVPGVFHYYLPHTETLDGWKRIPSKGPRIIDLRNHQIVRAAAVDAPRDVMTGALRAKLRAVVATTVLSNLTVAEDLDAECMATITADIDGAALSLGWPSWTFANLSVDDMAEQTVAFVRSIANPR